MFRRNLLIGALSFTGMSVSLVGATLAQQAPAASLKDIKDAILKASGYSAAAVTVTSTRAQFVVTILNSKLIGRPSIERDNEASRMAAAIERAIVGKPEYRSIAAIHVDYVQRREGTARTRVIDGVDFRKDAQGRFQLHVT